MSKPISRRSFFGLTAKSTVATGLLLAMNPAYLEAASAVQVDTPLDGAGYPNRDWEQIYRDIRTDDSTYTFTCSPNDTHNCILLAHVKNGIVTRITPTYGYGKATDLYGNRASARWDPRACQKGLVLHRKFYGDRRVRRTRVRKGFLEWAEAGFPRDPVTGKPQMDTTRRGEDTWVEVDWEKALDIAARAVQNIAQTYNGDQGADYLLKQGYDPDMVHHKNYGKHGVRTIKLRGGMPLLGVSRIFAFYRFANMLALLDAHINNLGPAEAKGAKYLDSYSWHTDLPPGHPMVTGHQTVDFELWAAEHADLVVTFGMNWIATKMPDGHWLSEARLKGTKVINVSTDYQATAQRADEVMIIRPGTDAALMLGCAKVILDENLHDEENVKNFTDLPLLVRMDNLELLRARDLGRSAKPWSQTRVYATDANGKPIEELPPIWQQRNQWVSDKLRAEWDDPVVWNQATAAPETITRDHVGEHFKQLGIDPALTGTYTVTLADGRQVKVRPVFDLIKQYLDDNFDLQTVSELTWAPKEAIQSLARQIAAHKKKSLMLTGMGPNHYFNNDLKDRAVFLLAALTDNVGHMGGNVGSYSGNYRSSNLEGIPHYNFEDPFNPELDPEKLPAIKKYAKGESAHFYNYGDRPLKAGNKNFTGSSHMPSPTKLLWFANSNSLLGNAKWHYDLVHNTLPGIDAIFVNEWWWTASCEYADIVFGADAWCEFPYPDMTASNTNPFLVVHPATPRRHFDTRMDHEIMAGVAKRLSELTGEQRMADYFKFIHEGRPQVYLQRILDGSPAARGYKIDELHEKAKQGIPTLLNFRTYPRSSGYDQRYDSKPWYTKSGRLEFYRDEPEFIDYGENLPVWREPVDSTYFDPNAILARPHPAIRPKGPSDYGIDPGDRSAETRQVRNVVYTWEELKQTKHPLAERDPGYAFPFITPKYRHGTHTTPIDIDWISVYFGPYGDMYRHDKRKPWVTEGYVEINPAQAKQLGIEDGDYVWVDADPDDRPYRGAKEGDAFQSVARLMCRARYNSAMPPGVLKMFYNMYQATKGTVKAQKERPDGLAKNAETNYQAMFRHGGHQSGTRAWLRPTLLTDTMAHRPFFGEVMGKGFEADVHCADGAPKESFVKISKAEPGGYDGEQKWLPARLGIRPTYESDEMKRYLQGAFVKL